MQAVSVSDIAGSLAKITGAIGAAGGNIIDVAHERVFTWGTIRQSDVRFRTARSRSSAIS